MPESIISQFKREYNAPIEVDRQVGTINARDNINVLTRWEGMIVYVILEAKSYILVGGTDNTNWQEIAGIGEAPIDGQAYIRKDGAWELMPSVDVTTDSGTSGITLVGATSGAYTITSQFWRWVKIDDVVNFVIGLTEVNGSTPVGTVELNLDSSFPNLPSVGFNFPTSLIGTISTSFSSIVGRSTGVGNRKIQFIINADSVLSSVDLTTAQLYVSGSYLTAI